MENEKRLIDANALLEKIQFRIEPQGIVGETVRDMVEKTREIIMAEPTVEVVHGRWELYPSSMHRRCSVCKMEYDRPKFNVRANYCPNCGAKMDGDGNA